MSDNELDFDAFVEVVRSVDLDDSLVHEASHSTAVSTRNWVKSETPGEDED